MVGNLFAAKNHRGRAELHHPATLRLIILPTCLMIESRPMGVRNRLRSLFRLFLLFTVLVGVALVSAITTIRFTIHGRQENMPRLLGTSLESAQRTRSLAPVLYLGP